MSEDKKIIQVFSIFGDDNVQFKKYDSLVPKNEYDHEKAETLAEAMTELNTINRRKKFLESLLTDNIELNPFLWTSMDGRVQALHQISEVHFRNVINFLLVKGRPISKEIRCEAALRGIEIPENYTSDDERFDDDYLGW